MERVHLSRRLQVCAATVVGAAFLPLTPIATGEASAATAVTAGDVAANKARTYKGVNYVSGGESYAGVDCSGLAQTAWAKAGVTLPRTANAQYLAVKGKKYATGKPGDLIFYSSGSRVYHVGIYLGGGKMIDASGTGRKVFIREPWSSDRVSGYFRPSAAKASLPAKPADRNCSSWAHQEAATAWFRKYYPYYQDFANLDSNNDMQPCEALPW